MLHERRVVAVGVDVALCMARQIMALLWLLRARLWLVVACSRRQPTVGHAVFRQRGDDEVRVPMIDEALRPLKCTRYIHTWRCTYFPPPSTSTLYFLGQ